MRPQYLADSWYFIALLDRFDNHRQSALRISERMRGPITLTHYGVVNEVLAFFSAEGVMARRNAVDWARGVLASKSTLALERPLVAAALDLYAARPDKEYSLVDCTSMVIMKSFGIRHVLTNDHHFSQEGFTVVSE